MEGAVSHLCELLHPDGARAYPALKRVLEWKGRRVAHRRERAAQRHLIEHRPGEALVPVQVLPARVVEELVDVGVHKPSRGWK